MSGLWGREVENTSCSACQSILGLWDSETQQQSASPLRSGDETELRQRDFDGPLTLVGPEVFIFFSLWRQTSCVEQGFEK